MMQAAGRRTVIGLCVSIFLIALAPYLQTGRFDAISFDDPIYLRAPSMVDQGVTPASIRWAFTTFMFNWHPLTWMSLMLDVSAFGNRPGPMHLHSAVLHALNAALLFVLLLRITGEVWPAAVAATLFAVHPLRVEPVVWISARKDVLSSFYWLLTILLYAEYARRKDAGRTFFVWYALALASLALGLMAKGMLVTLPVVLLLLDCWPLRRFAAAADDTTPPRRNPAARFGELLMEKAPMFLIVAAGVAVTVAGQTAVNAVSSHLPLSDRLANAAVAYVRYLRMTVAPYGLAYFYPHVTRLPEQHFPIWQPLSAAAFLLATTVLLLRAAPRGPWLLVGWGWYVITLLPVIGLVQIGDQALADRYTYVPSIGLMIALAWSLARVPARYRPVVTAAVVVLVALLLTLTWRQAGFWRDSVTLYRHAIAIVPENYRAHADLGEAYESLAQADLAKIEYGKALDIRPREPVSLHNLAVLAWKEGRDPEAQALFRQAIAADPNYAPAYHYLALTLAAHDQLDEAIALWRRALQLKPDFDDAKRDLNKALAYRRQLQQSHRPASPTQPATQRK